MKGGASMKHGKKPTLKQKIRIGKAGLSPENWLVVSQKKSGDLVLLHKINGKIRVIQAAVS